MVPVWSALGKRGKPPMLWGFPFLRSSRDVGVSYSPNVAIHPTHVAIQHAMYDKCGIVVLGAYVLANPKKDTVKYKPAQLSREVGPLRFTSTRPAPAQWLQVMSAAA